MSNSKDEADASAAYQAGQWQLAADTWLRIAASSDGDVRARALYLAACCVARDGRVDEALALLAQSAAAGFRQPDQLARDEDFLSLRSDPRWQPIVATATASFARWEQTLTHPELRRELLALAQEDQLARQQWIEQPDAEAALDAVDKKILASIKQLIAQHGWPAMSAVGEDGAHAAWLLVQHADSDVAFQKHCLQLLQRAVEHGEAEHSHLAYLIDRVAVAEGRPQLYGTQFDDAREPHPIEQPGLVDQRREAMGLPPLADYRKQLMGVYGPPAGTKS